MNNNYYYYKQLCTCSTLFVEDFFVVVLHVYNMKLPETSWLHQARFMEEMPYVFLFPFFFTVAHFTLVAVGIFSPPLQNLMLFALLSLFLCLSLSQYSKFVDMTINRRLRRNLSGNWVILIFSGQKPCTIMI